VVDAAEHPVPVGVAAEADEDEIKATAEGVKEVFEDIEAITLDGKAGKDTASDEESDATQLSIHRFDFDDEGIVHTAATLKMAYYACVVLVAWSLTVGSLG
jgi:hypothetical protein